MTAASVLQQLSTFDATVGRMKGIATVLKELTVTRFRFGCTHCGQGWTADYDVQHVEDGHGHAWDYYSLNGSPVTAPTAPGVVCCPACGTSKVHVELIAARPIPLAPPPTAAAESTVPREPADTQQQAARREAPLLAGDGSREATPK